MSLRDVTPIKPVKPKLSLSSDGSKSSSPRPISISPVAIPPAPCLPSTSKPIQITKPLPAILRKAKPEQLKLPIDCRKQLFVSIPPVKPSTSTNNISIQPSSSKKRNSAVFEATSFSKLAFDNDPSSPQPVKPRLFHPGFIPTPPEPPSLLNLSNCINPKSKQAKPSNGLLKSSKSVSNVAAPRKSKDFSATLYPKPTLSVSTIAHSTQRSVHPLLALDCPKPTKTAINSLPKLKATRTLPARDSKTQKRDTPLASIKKELLDKTISQSLGSPVYSPSDFPPRQPDFDYSSFKINDVVLVDRTEIGDGLRKATIVYVNKEYSPDYEYFHGHLVVLKPSARERSRNCEGKQTVYYVHYARLDRRMDEWIDIHEIHSAVDSSTIPSFSQLGSNLIISDFNDPPTKKTRSQKKKAEEFQHNEKAPLDYGATLARCEEVHEKATMLKNIDTIQIGANVVRCWYFSPYPADVITGRHLYICEHCLMYFSSRPFFQMHIGRCQPAPPPGELIYYDKENRFACYEVIGAENRFYCESLCLLSKLFLDHKTLYYQVDTFYFYVLCEIDDDGTHHIVGHFSKENYSMNNLACIMVLPPYQRKGYGKFLIQLSYAFSCREGFIGTPEKPLSDLGKVSYRGFWWWLLINYIDEGGYEDDINVMELERVTGISADDIISTFEPMEFVKKYKGEMCISMSPTILKFCKSLPLFTGPKLLLDCDLIKWTERYLPVDESTPAAIRIEHEEIKEEVVEKVVAAPTVELTQTIVATHNDFDMEVDDVSFVYEEDNNNLEEEFEDDEEEYEDVDDEEMNDDEEYEHEHDETEDEEEEPDIEDDENIEDLDS